MSAAVASPRSKAATIVRAAWPAVVAARPYAARWVLAIGGAVVVFSALVLSKGANPVEVFSDMWISTFTHPRSVTEIFARMGPIALAALAVVLPARAGMINVGGEGQVMVGAVGAAGAALLFDERLPGSVMLGVMFLAGALAGAAWAGLAALLRVLFSVNEAVTTLLLNFVAIDLLLFLIYSPWRESATQQPASREIADGARLPLIAGTKVHIGIVIAVIAAVALAVALGKTRWGFRLGVVGGNAEAARRAAMPVTTLLLSALVVGGLLAGLAGVIQLSGEELKLRPGFATEIGYLGFLASWLGRHKPIPVLIAAFVLTSLSVAGDSLQLDAGLPAATVNVLTALLLIAVLGWTTVKSKKGAKA